MQPALRLVSAAVVALLSSTAFASTTIHTLPATFVPSVAAGASFENFDALGHPVVDPTPFAGGAFTYTATTVGGIYGLMLARVALAGLFAARRRKA